MLEYGPIRIKEWPTVQLQDRFNENGLFHNMADSFLRPDYAATAVFYFPFFVVSLTFLLLVPLQQRMIMLGLIRAGVSPR